MAPKILDQSGNEVYGTGFVDRKYAVDVGISGYSRSVDGAAADPRVAGKPLVVKGLKVSGSNKADISVSNDDSDRIHLAAQSSGFLRECRVMIVVGE